MSLMQSIIRKARANPQKIVFPEGSDPRIIESMARITRRALAKPILLGKVSYITKKLESYGIEPESVTIIDPEKAVNLERYAALLYKKRKHKGMTREQATELAADPIYFATLMVESGEASGLVGGAEHTTADTIRPALQIIKTEEEYHKVSGLFVMMLDDGSTYLFADCAVNIEPNSKELAQIAVDTARTAKRFGLKPKVAMLSFSTYGSANHPNIEKVRKAVEIFKKIEPKIPIEGEIQVDAALDPTVRKKKIPGSRSSGHANVLIFPDLEAGNIAYKLVERLAFAKAVGPIIQGLTKPVNDLSRGCSVEDIVDVTAMTCADVK